MVDVADCERVQTNWFRARADALGGSVWTDGGMLWTDGPDGLNVMFPDELDLAALQRGVSRARESGRGIVGAWLGLHVDPAPLAAAGFSRGWSPWWMTAELSDVPDVDDPRVRLEPIDVDRYRPCTAAPDHPPSDDPRITFAAARTDDAERPVGRAWSFVDGDLAGIFDMDVWPGYQRRGIGTGLLSAVCGAAREAGAVHAVLNATPDGKQLYSTCGFTQIGEGITWWHHLGSET